MLLTNSLARRSTHSVVGNEGNVDNVDILVVSVGKVVESERCALFRSTIVPRGQDDRITRPSRGGVLLPGLQISTCRLTGNHLVVNSALEGIGS